MPLHALCWWFVLLGDIYTPPGIRSGCGRPDGVPTTLGLVYVDVPGGGVLTQMRSPTEKGLVGGSGRGRAPTSLCTCCNFSRMSCTYSWAWGRSGLVAGCTCTRSGGRRLSFPIISIFAEYSCGACGMAFSAIMMPGSRPTHSCRCPGCVAKEARNILLSVRWLLSLMAFPWG